MTDISDIDMISSVSSAFSCSSAKITSEDEVIWGLSDEWSSDSSQSDYVLLPRTGTIAPVYEFNDSDSEAGLSVAFDLLSVTASSDRDDLGTARRKTRQTRAVGAEDKDSSSPSPSPQSDSGAKTPTLSYEDAAAYITKYLESPCKEGSTNVKLQFLQALVVEFGISQQVPTTITSAKKLLKAEAHVNVKQYIATRGEDQGALQQIMHPSKNALRHNIQRTGNRKSLKWVKDHGLDVFLIDCYN